MLTSLNPYHGETIVQSPYHWKPYGCIQFANITSVGIDEIQILIYHYPNCTNNVRHYIFLS